MKCFTVTEAGVTPGIRLSGKDPYPFIGVGDPANSSDYRRVEADKALADGSKDGVITSCSIVLDMNEEDNRRSSYKMIPATGTDDDKALVLVEARASKTGRTHYDLPRYAFNVASGWHANGPVVTFPVNLVIINKDSTIKVMKTEDITKGSSPFMAVQFDGTGMKKA